MMEKSVEGEEENLGENDVEDVKETKGPTTPGKTYNVLGKSFIRKSEYFHKVLFDVLRNGHI
jgi:hypothetical protein